LSEISGRQRRVCLEHQVMCDPPNPGTKVGVALTSKAAGLPLNGLRHPPGGDANGWYFWWGGEPSSAADFFAPLHVEHVAEEVPDAVDFLALPPGWRFLKAGEYVDVWFDPELLKVWFDAAGAATTWDANGKRSARGDLATTHDGENRLVQAVKGGMTVNYRYDASGRRVMKDFVSGGTDMMFLSAGDTEIAEYDGAGALLRRYVPGLRTDDLAAMVEANGGKLTCQDCGRDDLASIKSEKGVPTPDNQAHIHHDPALQDGGSRGSKAIVLCPKCHNDRHLLDD
jgi:YD repeat-containing protein